jgi:hypothetical protein
LEKKNKRKIRQASEIVKKRVQDQTLSMKLEDFMKSMKGGKAMHRSLNAMFREEPDRLP